jgi:hypothetical protein
MQNELNTNIFIIRSESKIIKTVVGIENALDALSTLPTINHIGIFMGDKLSMSAVQFRVWGTRMNRLINHNIGSDGQPVNMVNA